MILSFSKARFVDLINAGEKIHTIRRDEKKRWKVGAKIHFWYGSPRNKQTAEGLQPYGFPAPDRFYEGGEFGIVTSVQEVLLQYSAISDSLVIRVLDPKTLRFRHWLSENQIEELAKNDGLTIEEMKNWFVPNPDDIFYGRIIQWKPDPVIYGRG